MSGDRGVDLEVIFKGLDWAEVVVACCEYKGAAQFSGTLRPRDAQGSEGRLVAGCFESNGNRFLDMEFWVEGSDR